MKQHQKWLNETLGKEEAEKFEVETSNVTTVDEIINTISETAWRGALELVLGWLDYSSEHKEIADKIHDELE